MFAYWFNHKVVWEVIIYRLRDFFFRPNMYSRPFSFNASWVILIGPKIELYKHNAKQIVKGINTRFDLSITLEILFQNFMLVQWTWNNNMIFKMLFIFNSTTFTRSLNSIFTMSNYVIGLKNEKGKNKRNRTGTNNCFSQVVPTYQYHQHVRKLYGIRSDQNVDKFYYICSSGQGFLVAQKPKNIHIHHVNE